MQKHTFTDQMKRLISVSYPPKRIISLVPSQTELLFDLGLNEEVIGITKFCIHPHEKFKSTIKVGGTKNLDLNKIKELKPDLIIANKEENEKSQIEELMKSFPVWISDIQVLDDAVEMIKGLGQLTAKAEKANSIASTIHARFLSLSKNLSSIRTAYFIWKNPFMLAGTNTFINDMLSRGGFENIIEAERYPEISKQGLIELNPECIFLSSEPYPFKTEHIDEMSSICPNAKISVVDGEMFSWYGSRLLQTPDYLRSLRSDYFF